VFEVGDTANRWAIAYSGAAGTKSLGFYENGSSSHVMTLSGSRVGIGTTGPLGVFHASGSSGKSIVLGAAGLNGEGVYLAGYDGWATIIDQRHASDGHGLYVKLNHAETDKIGMRVINTSGTLFTVQSSGKVGIGTTDPAVLLHVSGSATQGSAAVTIEEPVAFLKLKVGSPSASGSSIVSAAEP
jgi:hypothetical protein